MPRLICSSHCKQCSQVVQLEASNLAMKGHSFMLFLAFESWRSTFPWNASVMNHHLLHKHLKKHAVFPSLPSIHGFVANFGTSLTFKKSRKQEGSNIDNALKVLDLVPRKGDGKEESPCHHRVIIDCIHDILGGQSKHVMWKGKETNSSNSNPGENLLESVNSNSVSGCHYITSLIKDDAFMLLVELHQRGISVAISILASALSFCVDRRAPSKGAQLHALLVKTGHDLSVLVGSSLISLYSRCGQLENASRVFQSMPTKNTISWTALISGYAQDSQVEPCLHLFALMRQSVCKPNDITFATVLSVCTNHAFLALGKSVHGLELRMGFDLNVHISNALISMYAKCGNIEEAHFVFENIACKDLFSWNSMIFGYSQYGLAEHCLDLLQEMDRQCMVPDAISFLGVLSSCRHACLVEEGRRCFKTMLERGIEPELDHYSCMIDLLGRVGLLDEAWDLIQTLPTPPNAIIWGSLLSACRVHRKFSIGIHAAEQRLKLEPSCAVTHLQLANLYASISCWSNVARVRKLMKDRGLKTNPGCSWIEVGNEVYTFTAENRSNNQENDVLVILDCLQSHMQCKYDMHIDDSRCNNPEHVKIISNTK